MYFTDQFTMFLNLLSQIFITHFYFIVSQLYIDVNMP